jgi:hypothetical protein
VLPPLPKLPRPNAEHCLLHGEPHAVEEHTEPGSLKLARAVRQTSPEPQPLHKKLSPACPPECRRHNAELSLEDLDKEGEGST